MPSRRLPVLVLTAALVLTASASASRSTSTDSAGDVRLAIVAAAAYADDHGGSYAGLTVTKMRRWLPVKNITVRRASRRSYCIQSISGRMVNFAGPSGRVRYGRCGTTGPLVPAPPPPKPKPQPTGDAATAEKRLRNASISALAYYTDFNTYAGMTLAKLQAYDKQIVGVNVEWATRSNFCLQSTVGAATLHVDGKDFKPTPGVCPARPS